MTDAPETGRVRSRLGRFRVVHLAPVFALLALIAWAFASPIGAGPDDDYHLVSTWCANGGSEQCEPGATESTRTVPSAFRELTCYVQLEERSAGCQGVVWPTWDGDPWETKRGNFVGQYPPVYYSSMWIFAGDDLQTSALVMRIVNAVLFVGLATALVALLPVARRRTLLWGWLVTLVPLGVFLIPSNNPSGWAVTGVGTAFLALLGWFETTGRRRWALGALYVVGVLMAAGSRGDAAVYVAGATVTVMILTAARTRAWATAAILPAAGLLFAVVMFAVSGQAGVGAIGFDGGGVSNVPGSDEGSPQIPLGGFGLLAYNLLMLPFLWTGVWGTWGLGWFDTRLPAIVPWAAAAAFIVVAFTGLARVSWRKAISVSGVLLVLIVLPVYVLTVGGDRVGSQLQPRYLLPLIVLLALLLIVDPARRELRFTRLQTFAILGALGIANLVALHVNIRRYVTGVDVQGVDLDAGAEWWWSGFPLGATAVWAIGALAFVALLIVLAPYLRRSPAAEADAVEADARAL